MGQPIFRERVQEGGAPDATRTRFIPAKFTNKVQRQVRDETDGGGRRPMIRPSSDMHATRVTNFVPNPLVSERFSPTQPPGCLPHHRSGRLSGTKARRVDSTRKCSMRFRPGKSMFNTGTQFQRRPAPQNKHGISIVRLVFLPNFQGLRNGRQRLFMAVINA